MELTQPRLEYFFNHFIVIKVFTLANGGHTGHSPQLITATIQACLVFQFVRLLRQAYGFAGTQLKFILKSL
jgi:hypothetical protein